MMTGNIINHSISHREVREMDEITIHKKDSTMLFADLDWLISAKSKLKRRNLHLIFQLDAECIATDGFALHMLNYKPLPIGSYSVIRRKNRSLCFTPVEGASAPTALKTFFEINKSLKYKTFTSTSVRDEQAAAEILRRARALHNFDCIRNAICWADGRLLNGEWEIAECASPHTMLRFTSRFADEEKGRRVAYSSRMSNYSITIVAK